MRRWSRLSLIVSLMVLFGVGMTLPAQAADVTIAAGDTQGIIDAINQANKAGQAAIIDLAPNATYTATAVDHSPFYLFGKEQNMGTTGPDAFPVITSNVTINGNGSTITRSGSAMFRFFETFQTGTLTLNDLTLTNGNVNDGKGDSGGAVSQISGTLVLNNCVLTGNQAEDGGALDVLGTATVSHTRIENNVSGDMGGGIDVEDISIMGRGLTLDDSDIDNNHASNEGGGLSVSGSAVITNSRIENNVADTEGGGIYIDENGNVNISKGTIIAANQTVNDGSGAVGPFGGAGIDSYFGNLTVDGSVISDNKSAFVAGAFFDRGGTFNISNTLITRNQAREIGGIYSLSIAPSDETLQRDGHVTIANSCLVDNTDTDPQSKGMREGIVNDTPEDATTIINAVNNWWGDASGPGSVAGGKGGKGQGDGVGASINYQPFLSAELDACNQIAANATPVVAVPLQPTPTSDQSSDSAGVPGFAGCAQPSDGSFQITIPKNAYPAGSMVTCSLDGSAFSLIVLSSSGAPLEKFGAAITVCLPGSGTMSYMGLANATGLPAAIKTTQKNGYTCANLPEPGILLMNG